MKPLTRYAMGTGMNIEPHMAPWPEGKYYRVDQVDARIAELEARALRADDALHREAEWRKQAEAERDAARADAERNRVNAERYEWLRSRVPGSTYRIIDVIYSEGGEGVDAAIDAARGGA